VTGERLAEPAGRRLEGDRDALHLFSQVVGKVKLEKTPLVNHWWNVTLLVSPRGLTSGAVPDGTRLFQMDVDFIDSQLQIISVEGRRAEVALRSMSVADFYAETFQALADLDIWVEIRATPNDLLEALPFDQDQRLREYRPEHAQTVWLQLVQAHRVLSRFRAGFVGKASPRALVLGLIRSGGDPLLRPSRSHASRRRAELPGLGDGRGLLPRGVELWVLAWRWR
jgi:hypothetical protein